MLFEHRHQCRHLHILPPTPLQARTHFRPSSKPTIPNTRTSSDNDTLAHTHYSPYSSTHLTNQKRLLRTTTLSHSSTKKVSYRFCNSQLPPPPLPFTSTYQLIDCATKYSKKRNNGPKSLADTQGWWTAGLGEQSRE